MKALVVALQALAEVARERGWPSVTITINDGAVGVVDDSMVEKTPAIGFALPHPDEGDDDDDFAEDVDR